MINDDLQIQAITVLHTHYGLPAGGRRHFDPPPWRSFEDVAGIALGHDETTITESISALLTLTIYDAGKLVANTPGANMPRLRLAATVANLLLDITTWGILDSLLRRRQLDQLLADPKVGAAKFRAADEWNNALRGGSIPAEYWTAFFIPMGLFVRWPLADFIKTWEHTKACRLGGQNPTNKEETPRLSGI